MSTKMLLFLCWDVRFEFHFLPSNETPWITEGRRNKV